jgi:hypothetical protein
MRNSISRPHVRPLKLFAGAAAAALIIGWTAGVGAQTAAPSPPQQQASLPANTTAPPVPLGANDVREVQNQLIALGFTPGPADGQIGPGTITAVQQYDNSHGGNGQAQIDSALLARLKADKGPRLTYEQVAEKAQTQTSAPAASGSNQLGGIVQQIVPLIGAAISNSNNNNGYGPGYYGPPPGYNGYGYGGY